MNLQRCINKGDNGNLVIFAIKGKSWFVWGYLLDATVFKRLRKYVVRHILSYFYVTKRHVW